MNKVIVSWLIIILTLVTITSCGGESSPSTTAPSVPDTPTATPPSLPENPTATEEVAIVESDPTDRGANLLVVVEGAVLLKRNGWGDYHATGFGVAVQRGDLLRLPDGAEATLLCDNLNIWNVPGGPAPSGLIGCPRPAEPALIRRGVKIASTRGGDPNVPYLISPRSTKLLTARPTLRWNAPAGANSYTVQVRGGDLQWMAENVTETSLVYPGDPPLEPGVSYLLIVEDDTERSSQDEGAKGLGFSILSVTEVADIEARHDQIAGLGLSNTAEQYATAQYYASQGLIAEAIEILEELIQAGSDEAAIHQTLADLYAQIGLLLLAQERYNEAITLADIQDNLEILATSRANLGVVETRLGNVEAALAQLTQAKTHYEALGEAEQVADIEELLELLQ